MNISQDMSNIEKMEEQQAIKNDVIAMIKQWSETFGLPVNSKAHFPDIDREIISIKLIEEELKELKEGLSKRDLTEVIDASGDLLWVVVRLMMEYGIDPLKTIQEVHTSNMSKLDRTEEDADKTREKYQAQDINTYCRQVGDYWITYRATDNKVLKSHKFKEPDFSNQIK